jgi:hypothetical protein
MGRGSTWQEEEVQQLCRSFLYISEDPTVGCEQSRTTFWERVHGHMKDRLGPEFTRAPEATRNKWTDLQREVQKFNSFFLQVSRNNPSGTTYDDRIQMALEFASKSSNIIE